MRQLHFEDKLSRFQSFFAFQELDDAIEFGQAHRGGDVDIVEVECEDFEVRDMDLVGGSWFGNIISKGRDYWAGNAGSDGSTWEVVMDPPVEIIDTVDDPV
ncbi:hypothetical protein EL22_21080 [Halostagnicola sp. A56]|uniref:hypothetical protein n=1 Tax=Halostagnicola sp. A56 TaxID=1495067 RepID=UPI00065F69C5|nr:hypothetical protein [Halostagnicola sp. A56]KDE56764.2 hypothetical protein EL22_21080 [Halostagnicola sp. A56]